MPVIGNRTAKIVAVICLSLIFSRLREEYWRVEAGRSDFEVEAQRSEDCDRAAISTTSASLAHLTWLLLADVLV